MNSSIIRFVLGYVLKVEAVLMLLKFFWCITFLDFWRNSFFDRCII